MNPARSALAGMLMMTMIMVAGCQSTALERARQMSMRPGSLVDPVFTDNATEISPDAKERAAEHREDMRNRNLLSDMEAQDRDFNRRLSGVLGQGAASRPGRLVDRKSVV